MKIVFDTNIWLNFVERLEYNYIDSLLEKILTKEIEIILPISIETEFNQKTDKITSEVIKQGVFTKEDVNSIIESIKIIFNKSQKLKPIELGLAEWVNSQLAPNHNAKNWDDTLILNTLLNLPKNYSFYFISNDSDFRVSKKEYNLHPDIIKKFTDKSIDIEFYIDYVQFFGQKKMISKSSELSSYELYNWKTIRLRLKNKNMLDQLTSSIEYYYKELNFIPLSYFSNNYPFNNGNSGHTYFEGATLVTNNKVLFDFFNNSLIQRKGKEPKINVKNFSNSQDIERFRNVIKRLNGNLVHGLKFERVSIKITLENNKKTEEKCDCLQCTHSRREVKDLTTKCQTEEKDSPKRLIQKAYFLFKVKQLNESYTIINNLSKTIDRKEYPTLYFILNYNKDILKKMWLEGDDLFTKERNKIKSENENSILKKGISSIVGYLMYTKYFDYKYFDLTQDLESVKGRYLINKGNGKSYISNVEWKNIIRWAELFQVVEENGIFFGFYLNIKRFAKYTFNLSLYASVDNQVKYPISEYMIKTTMEFLTIKDYKEVFSKLSIESLNYDENQNNKIFKLFCNKIDSLSQTIDLGENHSYLKIHLKEIEKILFIQSYLNFNKKQDNIIFSKIINIIKLDPIEELLSGLNHFVNKRKSNLFTYNAKNFISIILNSELSFITNITNIFSLLKTFPSISLNKPQFNLLLESDIESKTGYYNSYIYLELYELGSLEQKKQVLEKVYSILDSDLSFDFKLYTFFTSELIIEEKKEYLKKFKNEVEISLSKYNNPHHRNRLDKQVKKIEILNYLINHVYQFYDDTYKVLKLFKGHSPYYDFLIDPKGFELNEIDVHWLEFANRNSYLAIKKILKNHQAINHHFIESILKIDNNNYKNAYLELISNSDNA